MTNVYAIEKFRNETHKMTEEDYHVPSLQPYNKEHLKLNELLFNSFMQPAYFDLSHLGLDYDCHDIKDAEFVHGLSAYQDLQKQRFRQNKKRASIKGSVEAVGKDLRKKGGRRAIPIPPP